MHAGSEVNSAANAPRRRMGWPGADRPSAPPPWAQTLLAIAILVILLLPGAVKIQPDPYWATDPRAELAGVDPAQRSTAAETVHTGALGPAEAIWLHVAAIGLAAVALGVWVGRGGRLCHWSMALAGIGAAICLWHVLSDARHAMIGVAWLGAVALALAVRHVGCWPLLRCWLVAGLVAALWPMAAHAAGWVFHEHPIVVEQYQQNREAILQAHGWEVDSPQHEKFERRLMRSDAIGAYGFSNVFGSILVALTLLGAGLLFGLRARPRGLWGALLVLFPTLAAGAVAAVMTRARGALIAGVAAAALLAAWGWWQRSRTGMRAAVAAVALVAVALAGVLLIGLLMPPRVDSPWLSIIFRFHYWLTSLRIFAEQPWLGTGPAEFQAFYARLKPPGSPETVTSSHNVFIDFATMLGMCGLAWGGLLLGWLWSAGRAVGANDADSDAADAEVAAVLPVTASGPLTIRGRDVLGVLTVALPVQGARAVLEFGQGGFPFAAWLVGLVGFILVMTLLLSAGWLNGWGMRLGLAAAAVALLMHNQIEMTWYQHSSASLAWSLLALAAATVIVARAGRHRQTHGPGTRARRWACIFAAGIPALLAIVLVVLVAIPITRHQLAMRDAALAWRGDDAEAAMDALDRAIVHVPALPRPYRARADVAYQVAYLLREQHDRPRTAERWLDRAVESLDEAEASSVATTSMLRRRAALDIEAGRREGDRGLLEAAAERLESLRERLPHEPDLVARLGDLYWELGHYEKARAHYRAALAISDALYLDPADQLRQQRREQIIARLADSPGG